MPIGYETLGVASIWGIDPQTELTEHVQAWPETTERYRAMMKAHYTRTGRVQILAGTYGAPPAAVSAALREYNGKVTAAGTRWSHARDLLRKGAARARADGKLSAHDAAELAKWDIAPPGGLGALSLAVAAVIVAGIIAAGIAVSFVLAVMRLTAPAMAEAEAKGNAADAAIEAWVRSAAKVPPGQPLPPLPTPPEGGGGSSWLIIAAAAFALLGGGFALFARRR